MSRGGARKGSGRPKKEPTKAVRLPLTVIESIKKYTDICLPLYLSKVPAGFPSPAEDYIAEQLNLNDFLVKHPAATFLVRATGESMLEAGIHENDILVVDRSLTAAHGKIVVAAIDGQLTVKRLQKQTNGTYLLIPANSDFKPIPLDENNDIYIWGVVTFVIHTAQ